MAKLYAELETSRGKTVSVSDNESITATVYDGNKKAYSVSIEWCVIGDPEHRKCPHCGWMGDDMELETDDNCPECKTETYTVHAVMGAIVTSREWRNMDDLARTASYKIREGKRDLKGKKQQG